jgi:hypothetical protein
VNVTKTDEPSAATQTVCRVAGDQGDQGDQGAVTAVLRRSAVRTDVWCARMSEIMDRTSDV